MQATSTEESVTQCKPAQGHVPPPPTEPSSHSPHPQSVHSLGEVCSNGSPRVEFQAPVMKQSLGKERGRLESCKLFAIITIAWSTFKNIDLQYLLPLKVVFTWLREHFIAASRWASLNMFLRKGTKYNLVPWKAHGTLPIALHYCMSTGPERLSSLSIHAATQFILKGGFHIWK